MILLLALVAGAMGEAAAASSAPFTYTAQYKPRITVMDFTDTNTVADQARYGPSVSAMLVTFLKQQSQFIVVERQDIRELLREWEREQGGETNLLSNEDREQLFQRIDVILQGKVTVLGSGGGTSNLGSKIEIDAKLLSVADGRIVTAAKMHGPEYCLRQVVERLGSAIENDFLRPFYGKLTINFKAPENVHLSLTPILREDALDEERPPVERDATLYSKQSWDRESPDQLEEWVTNPSSYTIENVLSGWYTLRVRRAGYVDLQIRDLELRAAEAGQQVWIEYRNLKDLRWKKLDDAPQDLPWRSLVVHVSRLTTIEQTLDLAMEKTQGALQLIVFDDRGIALQDGRVLLRSLDLDINPNDPETSEYDPAIYPGLPKKVEPSAAEAPAQAAKTEDSLSDLKEMDTKPKTRLVGGEQEPTTQCDFVRQEGVPWVEQAGWVVRTGDSFDITAFSGGSLAFEDYRGEPVPSGRYQVAVWSPGFKLEQWRLRIEQGSGQDPRKVTLFRQEQLVKVRGRTDQPVTFSGEITGLEKELHLAENTAYRQIQLPVDRYQVSADLGTLGTWRSSLDLLPVSQPPRLDQIFTRLDETPSWREPSLDPRDIEIKGGLWTGGRKVPFPSDAYHDAQIDRLLDQALGIATAGQDDRSQPLEDNPLEKLTRSLQNVDLLILNPEDLARLKEQPRVTATIQEFVRSGHAVLAFATARGEYRSALGAPLNIPKTRLSRKLRLHPGQLSSFSVRAKLKLARKRPSPRMRSKKHRTPEWRILAYEKKRKRPRILERSSLSCGGYVLVWLEDPTIRNRPESPKRHSKKRQHEQVVESVDRVIGQVGRRALDWASYLMHRRLGGDEAVVRELAQRVEASESR